ERRVETRGNIHARAPARQRRAGDPHRRARARVLGDADGARSPETRPDRAMVRGPVRELPAGMDLRLRGTMAGAALEPVPAGGLSIAGQRHRGARIPSQPPRDDRASPVALGWACALHVALAGVLMFLCGRAAGLSRAAATLAAIGFMLSERVLI